MAATLLEETLGSIAHFRASLANGVQHYDGQGKFLPSVEALLDASRRGDPIHYDITHQLPVITEKEMLEQVWVEYERKIQQ